MDEEVMSMAKHKIGQRRMQHGRFHRISHSRIHPERDINVVMHHELSCRGPLAIVNTKACAWAAARGRL